jgi:peptidoglycan/LPS O-acetylase OafA/YrhL
LRYEILCYALVALIGVWRGVRWTVAAAVVLAMALAAQVVLGRLGAPAAGVATTLAELIGCFFAGAALYALRDRVPFSPALAAGAAAALAAAALIGGLRLVFPLAGSYLLLFLGCWRALPLQGFGRFGDFSYGLYVFAYPIQQAIVQHAGTGISIPLFFALAFVATLGLAILSWHFIEAPSLAHKPRRAPVRVTAPSCPTGAVWPVTSPGGS